MKLYIYLTPFLLCFYILICDAEVYPENWVEDIGNSMIESIYRRNEFDTSTLSALELMQIRNSTALEYWRRDYKQFDDRVRHHKRNKKSGRVTRSMAKTKEITLQERQKLNKHNSRHRRHSQVYTDDETQTSPMMRSEYEYHKNKREVNFQPNFRHSTANYRSTQLTPLSQEKLQEVKEEDSVMQQMISAYNIAEEVEEIINSIENLNMTKEVIGRTVTYKDIILVKTTECKVKKTNKSEQFRAADDDKYMSDAEQPEKKIVFIVHGLSVMGVQYMPCFRRKSHFKKLVSFYFRHLDKFDIYLIPMANPDGYAYVMNNLGKFWNKNVSPQSACRGVALDRNFDVSWSTRNSTSSCSQQYSGESPFSEPETRAVRDIFHRFGHKIVAYFNVHSGSYNLDTFKGDAVLYPKGFTDVTTDDDKYIDLRGEIDEAMKNASFEAISVYVDTLHSWYGKISGTSVDYASTVYGVPYALEFVMQLYSAVNANSKEKENNISDAALEEIWGRVIDTTFNNIYKSLNGNDV